MSRDSGNRLCMLPGTILYVVGADAVTKGVAKGTIPWLLIAVVCLALIVITIIVRRAGRTLQSKPDQIQSWGNDHQQK